MKLIPLIDDTFVDDVAAIEESSFSIPWSKAMLLDEFTKSIACYIGIEHEGKIIAYGGFWKILDEGHITNIAVAEDFRRKGIGKCIIDAIIDRCISQGIKAVTLEVRESNVAAISLYTAFGFEAVGKRKGYYEDNKEDALIMWKHL